MINIPWIRKRKYLKLNLQLSSWSPLQFFIWSMSRPSKKRVKHVSQTIFSRWGQTFKWRKTLPSRDNQILVRFNSRKIGTIQKNVWMKMSIKVVIGVKGIIFGNHTSNSVTSNKGASFRLSNIDVCVCIHTTSH